MAERQSGTARRGGPPPLDGRRHNHAHDQHQNQDRVPVVGRLVTPGHAASDRMGAEPKSTEPKSTERQAAAAQGAKRHDGQRGDPSSLQAADEPLGRFGHNKVGILVTIFLISGILGLPLLLLSPAFSKTEMGFWTIAVVIYTVILLVLLGTFLLWAWNQL